MCSQFRSIIRDHSILKELHRRIHFVASDPALRGLVHGQDIDALMRGLPETPPVLDALGVLESLESKLGVLEKLVRLTGRPVLPVAHGTFADPLLHTWGRQLDAARGALEFAIASVGRVEVHGLSAGAGTAWMIADHVAVTTAQIARSFAYPSGGKYRLRKIAGKTARVGVDFRDEHPLDRHAEHEVVEVLYIGPDDGPDLALLRLSDRSGGRRPPAPIPLADLTIDTGYKLAVIGYPRFDPTEDPTVRRDVYRDVYGVKRLCLGEVMLSDAQEWFFRHDASSLGGDPGAVVLDLATGTAIGMHFCGTSTQSNHAVRTEALREALAQLELEPTTMPTFFLPTELPWVLEREVSLEGLGAREGYDAGFLGALVPAPRVQDPGMVARRQDGRAEPLHYRHFSLQVHREYDQAIWTAANLRGDQQRRPARPSMSAWARDPRLPDDAQIDPEFYRESGFSRVQLVRRLDVAWGEAQEAEEANLDTFHFTNASPRDQEYNEKFWGELADEALREADGARLTVMSGPVFSDDAYRHDSDGVEAFVPHRYWKIVALVRAGKLAASAYVLDQAPYLEDARSGIRWRIYQVAIADLERDTDLDFGEALRHADVFEALEATIRRRLLRDVSEAQFFRR